MFGVFNTKFYLLNAYSKYFFSNKMQNTFKIL